MSEEKYRVVLIGYTDSKGEYYIEIAYAKLFKITQEEAKKLFMSAPTMIKENLSKDEAERYKDTISKTGALCEVEDMKYNLSRFTLK